MRIIGGRFKGKKILEPKDKKTRPLKDLTKESIFNILKHSNKFNFALENSNILDLFSGIGSFGLEALSRNAKLVHFVENYTEALNILKTNIKNLNLEEKCEVIKEDILNDFNFTKLKKEYDLIFLDPPFKEKKINQLILRIYNSKILKNEGLLIIHRNKKENHIFPEELKILEKKTYGISEIFFCNFN